MSGIADSNKKRLADKKQELLEAIDKMQNEKLVESLKHSVSEAESIEDLQELYPYVEAMKQIKKKAKEPHKVPHPLPWEN
jgi:DNA anti-recombination protein RmuC